LVFSSLEYIAYFLLETTKRDENEIVWQNENSEMICEQKIQEVKKIVI
jgi:hypothetical protein